MAEKKRIGTMACEGARCKSHAQKIPVVVFENEKGTLTYRCDYCGRSPYARVGTDMHGDWMEDIKLFQAAIKPAAPAPSPAAKPAAPAPAAPVKTKLVF
jgi:hypothetical protein